MGICRINENDLFRQDWRSRSKIQVLQYVFLKWKLAFLVGLLTGLIATLINLAVENIAGYKLLLVSDYVQQKRYVHPLFNIIRQLNRFLNSLFAQNGYTKRTTIIFFLGFARRRVNYVTLVHPKTITTNCKNMKIKKIVKKN